MRWLFPGRCRLTDLAARTHMEPRPEGRRDLPLTQIQDFIAQRLSEQNFNLFSPFAEKHGSWEATFSQPSDEFVRFISVALTNEFAPSIAGPDLYTMEVWVGADSSAAQRPGHSAFEHEKRSAYLRHMVTQCKIPDDSFVHPENTGFLGPEFEAFLSQALVKAVEMARHIRSEDLVKAYSRGKIPKKENP